MPPCAQPARCSPEAEAAVAVAEVRMNCRRLCFIVGWLACFNRRLLLPILVGDSWWVTFSSGLRSVPERRIALASPNPG